MNQAKRDKWIAALRSGKYEQHRSTLVNHNQTAFCCLGVQMKIEGKDLSQGTPGASAFADVLKSGEYSTCIEMNDALGYSFNEIADYLETGKYKGDL